MFAVLYYVLHGSSCSAVMCRSCLSADDATEPGDGILTNLHVTDLNIQSPVPNQTCMFGQLRELDLDGGDMTGTIPFFLTQCFPFVNEIDLSYNQVEAPCQSNNCVCKRAFVLVRAGAGVVVVPSLLLSMLPVPALTQAVPLQMAGTLPAFMSTITSLVEMELQSNKVHRAAMLNAVLMHTN